MCLISFIVPVYNLKEEEVSKCITSIVNQTKTAHEIIIVDDGSNNGIENYCDIIGKQYGARVIHQQNQGLAVARNTGIKASRGEWIIHVDGDDWIAIDLVEVFEHKSQNSKADIFVWGFIVDSGYKKQMLLLNNKNAFNTDFSLIRENILCSIMDYENSFSSLALNTSWGKAYRREFIIKNELYYQPSLRRAQDAVYNLYAFNLASKVEYIDKALNYYRNDNPSLSRSYNPKNYDYLRMTAFAVKEFVSNNKVSQRVKDASEIFIQRCFRMINEQYYQNKENPQAYSIRRKLFIDGIKSDPFNSAFASGIKRNGMINRMTDLLYQNKMFGCIWLFNNMLKLASSIKHRI